MAIQHDSGFQIYVSKGDIPAYQRDWVWGATVLLVFICGLLIGWLLKPHFDLKQTSQADQEASGGEETLAQQVAFNQQLQTRIARLESLISSEDVCSVDAFNEIQNVLKFSTDK